MISYDPKCEELARHFLDEAGTGWSTRELQEFSQWIQHHAELWLNSRIAMVLLECLDQKEAA